MANFCGKCNTELDTATDLCPNCDREQLNATTTQNIAANASNLCPCCGSAIDQQTGLCPNSNCNNVGTDSYTATVPQDTVESKPKKSKPTALTTVIIILLPICLFLVLFFAIVVHADTKGTYENLEYEITDEEVTITGYVTEPEGELVIPETIEGYTVTTIGYDAFANCFSLTSVEMPEVQTIGADAFFNCGSLTSIEMPKVQTIGDEAFSGCDSLTSVEMSNVQTIGDEAFSECYALTSVEMPKVQLIDGRAFSGCHSLTSIIISSDNENYSVEGGILYNKDKSTLIAYPSAANDIKIADNVQTIGDYAFYNCDPLVSVEMPEVQTIGDEAFYGCESLTSVEMPEVQTIGDYAFSRCDSLTSVEMPKVQTIGNQAFAYCDLTSVEMPNVQTIGDRAFYICDSLTSVEMYEVQTVGDEAFSECYSLASAYFYSDAPTSFGEDVFYECAQDFTIYYANGTQGWSTPTWNGYPTYPLKILP